MSLLTYSGITTKVRAMESKLVSAKQFQELSSQEDVRGAVDYLKTLPPYKEIFANLEDSKLHRGNIEGLLNQSEYRDFMKLYRFANLNQRRFLDLYFMHYEIAIIKRILRSVAGHQPSSLNLSAFHDFFKRHSSIDLTKLEQAQTIPEFISGLEGSSYYQPLLNLQNSGKASLFDYELHLDLMYFKFLWRVKSKVLSKKEQKILDESFGSRLDLLNIRWIYRCKKYYNLTPAQIYGLLIPIHYKLKTDQIRQMAEAENLEAMEAVLRTTWYGSIPEIAQIDKPEELEGLYHQILSKIYGRTARRHPYSIAILAYYLFSKELEERKIIAAIEGIRYGLDSKTILSLVEKQ